MTATGQFLKSLYRRPDRTGAAGFDKPARTLPLRLERGPPTAHPVPESVARDVVEHFEEQVGRFQTLVAE